MRKYTSLCLTRGEGKERQAAQLFWREMKELRIKPKIITYKGVAESAQMVGIDFFL